MSIINILGIMVNIEEVIRGCYCCFLPFYLSQIVFSMYLDWVLARYLGWIFHQMDTIWPLEVKIIHWDLRKRQTLYIIPAHNSLISQVKYEPFEGYVLATASYDNTCRVSHLLNLKISATLIV